MPHKPSPPQARFLPEPLILRNIPTVTGSARGRGFGIPTINLALASIPSSLAHGVYACTVDIGDRHFSGAMSFGPRPSVNAGVAMEIHLIDETLDDLPPRVTVQIIAHIREIRTFKTTVSLVRQIRRDIDQIRGILKA